MSNSIDILREKLLVLMVLRNTAGEGPDLEVIYSVQQSVFTMHSNLLRRLSKQWSGGETLHSPSPDKKPRNASWKEMENEMLNAMKIKNRTECCQKCQNSLGFKVRIFSGTTHLIKDMSMINVKYNIYINIHIKYKSIMFYLLTTRTSGRYAGN